MAQPYLVAMNHSEWHAKNVLRKFNRNRPLGDIEVQHRYRPAQPVLSCRTVEIDSSGTRTYRSRNAIDIIEEQHRLIHEIYSKARNISSAPPGGVRSRPKVVTQDQVGAKGLQSLRVNGSSATTSQSRPNSAKTEFIVLKTRPNTTGSHRRRAQPAIDSEFRFESDPGFEASAGALQSTRQQIQQIWEPEQRTLDEGKFVRGKKDQPSVASSIDPRAGSTWLSFGGGQQERSSGVVDAFTAMKHEGQFYAIDGGTGTAVARQLHRGDKIRIGVNGQRPPPDYRLKEYQQNLGDEPHGGDTSAPIVPLCWTDQVQREDSVIVKPTTPKSPPTKPNLCESHPVVFKKFGIEGSRPPTESPKKKSEQQQKPRLAGVRVVEGYGINRRTSARTNIDGSRQRPSSRVTHISVNRQNADDENGDSPTYEDILDMRIKSRNTSGPFVHEQLSAAGKLLDSQTAETPINGDSRLNQGDSPNKAKAKPRPMSTISSSGSQDFGGFIVGAPPLQDGRHVTSPVDSPVPSGRAAGRKKNGAASRPPPHKPNLHKTAAASGTSIGAGRSQPQNTEFIHLSQQMCITKDHMSSTSEDNNTDKSRMTPRSRNTAAIKSVSEHNKPRDKDVKFKEQVEEIIPQDFSPKRDPVQVTKIEPVMTKDVATTVPQTVTTAPTDNQESIVNEDDKSSVDSLGSVDKKYAFNIPTADHEVESEFASIEREAPETPSKSEADKVQSIPEETS